MSTGLAARLREATEAAHRTAERAGVMPALLRGELPKAGYVELLANLEAIYVALEAALDAHCDLPSIAPLDLPGLRRVDALRHDRQRLGDSAGAPPLRDATRAYVAQLRSLSDGSPARLAAHAYVRYLGDLSGGQALARIVGRAYDDAEAIRFYDFGPADDVRRLAQSFRAGLDAVGDVVDEPVREAIVAEALDAFERHRMLFVELERA